MNTYIVFLVYGIAFVAAAALLWRFGSARWYWHLGAVVVAMGIGLMPPREGWQGPVYDMAVGACFIFLFVWGIGAVVEHLGRSAWHHTRGPQHHS